MSKEHTHLGRQRDRQKVAGKQPYEVETVMQRFGCPHEAVDAAIKAVGYEREDIYKWLRQNGYVEKDEA
jgi:hypothetical protein